MNPVNRRRFERFSVLPMYTRILVRTLGDSPAEFHGHVYDISEGGVRFELDHPIPAGTPVSIEVLLPGDASRGVLVIANIVWFTEDPDEPGPVKMAAAFTRFLRAGDRERLLNLLSSGRYARAA